MGTLAVPKNPQPKCFNMPQYRCARGPRFRRQNQRHFSEAELDTNGALHIVVFERFRASLRGPESLDSHNFFENGGSILRVFIPRLI